QGRARRALLHFDVASAVPASAVLEAVTLRLHLSSASDPETRVMTLHRVTGGWGEAGSTSSGGAGAPAEIGDATWLHRFYAATPWNTAGGDWNDLPSASADVSGTGDYA